MLCWSWMAPRSFAKTPASVVLSSSLAGSIVNQRGEAFAPATEITYAMKRGDRSQRLGICRMMPRMDGSCGLRSMVVTMFLSVP